MIVADSAAAPTGRLFLEAERVEAAAWRDMFEASSPRLARALGLRVLCRGGPVALVAAGVDHMLLNRAIGLGTHEPATARDVDEIVSLFAINGVTRYLIHVADGVRPAAVTRWIENAGLVRYPRNWVKLGRTFGDLAHAPTSLEIKRLDRADVEAAGEILTQGFDLPPAAGALFAGLIERPRWHLFGALDAGRVVGAAGLFVDGQTGYLAFASTARAHRGRGAQAALLERRIRTAFALGCRRVVSETGEEVPGNPQHSYQNLVRAGLVPVALRANWAPKGARW